jgi:hypothetical protein
MAHLSEEATFFWRAAVAPAEEVGRNIRCVGEGEKIVPRFGLAREDDVAGLGIFADIDFSRGEPERGWQPDGLTAAILEELCDFVHDDLPSASSQS